LFEHKKFDNTIEMGSGKHCTEEKRDIIQKLITDGTSYREVGRLVGCLNKMIKNALNYKENPETGGRKQSITTLYVNRLIRQSKKDSFKSATELKKGLKINATVQTVRTYLREQNLKACSPRKLPLLNARHISKRMKFSKAHANWSYFTVR